MVPKILFIGVGLFLGMASFAASADFEVPRTIVEAAKLPDGFDLLGVRTGMDIAQADSVLGSKGYRFKQKNKAVIQCSFGDCLTFNGERSYESSIVYTKDNEKITVNITPPMFGSAVYSIERQIDGSNNPIAISDDLLKSAQLKYGKKEQWKAEDPNKAAFENGVACWGVRDGAPTEPDKKTLMCNDNPYADNTSYPEAFFYLHRNGTYLEGRFIYYELADRTLMKKTIVPLKQMLQARQDEALAKQSRQQNSGKAPDL